ncbi:DEAD/DEAH box helicase [Variovorax sp. WS11]|uniref:ligase-associated DNA damage response endonuclease PdeM n=1 Tax=Variovorax sp. WS11 TaxID=1105204 RepID=UPI000D0D8884|nr:ligase-associated DNA damage response endonuclease PdeM [Variovorax sp. WS11]NDZ14197.1 ligase-associated DNA damage response endonuclease PdeM [Variovorax sp. WS11]PSL81201.1 DEAD/DEAH box helicase [Variovorax sp. WS11]
MHAASPSCRLEIAGESIELLPERAVWWPSCEVLFIADLHLGKAASFRALGQPVPHGTTAQNLTRLDDLIGQHQPRELVVLGDFLHDAQARTPQLLANLESWRERNAGLRCTLVRGNHDARAGDPPHSLSFDVVDEPYLTGPFAACHHPRPHPTHFVLGGHLHPVCKLQGSGRDSLRMPCFVREERRLILPAFGEFTGGWLMEAVPGRRFYGIGGDAVWPLPN